MHRLCIARAQASGEFHVEFSEKEQTSWEQEINAASGTKHDVLAAIPCESLWDEALQHPHPDEVQDALELILRLDDQSSGNIPTRVALQQLVSYGLHLGYNLGQAERKA